MSDVIDGFGDLDDSAMDVDGPTALMYRYSRRKSDSKSDENSQNSKCGASLVGGMGGWGGFAVTGGTLYTPQIDVETTV